MHDSGRDQAVNPDQASRRQPFVLVTDDHEDTRLMFRTLLAMRGYEIIEAADREHAVLLADSADPDLILMDGTLASRWFKRHTSY